MKYYILSEYDLVSLHRSSDQRKHLTQQQSRQQQTNPYYQQTATEYHFHVVLKENPDNAYGYHGD